MAFLIGTGVEIGAVEDQFDVMVADQQFGDASDAAPVRLVDAEVHPSSLD
jgi:hypothetical protein